jgi:glycine/D-amino acid oxidase-like deaminating enzyme
MDEALALEGNPPPLAALHGELDVDIVIVGGGYTGLWSALAILDRDPARSIAIVEADICGGGASGMNGGKVHGYWYALGALTPIVGADGALAIARAGSRAQDAIRAFATAPGRDLWWREAGNLRVSTSAAHDHKLDAYVDTAARLGVPDTAVRLSPAEVQAICASPAFRGGAFFPECGAVHPARLARALRAAALARGVRIYEGTPVEDMRGEGDRTVVRTPLGRIVARTGILATNVGLIGHPSVAGRLTLSSSYAMMTEEAPDRLEAIGWSGDEGFSDLRMFLRYFRKTPDGRVLMGTGSGPFAYGDRIASDKLRYDGGSRLRTRAALDKLLPAFADVATAKIWGGPLDISADRYPFVGTVPGSAIHYACGFSGHGVNPTWITGQCLASLALGTKDEWTALPLCTRTVPTLPPEPVRFLGGSLVRRAIMAVEDADEEGRSPPALAGFVASLPKRLGLRIGVR